MRGGTQTTTPKTGCEKMKDVKNTDSQDQQGSTKEKPTLWETDCVNEHGIAPLRCECEQPVLNKDLLKRTKNKLPYYRCGRCLSLWVKP